MIEYYAATKRYKNPCEIFVNGVQIRNTAGKTLWGSPGHARAALRNLLSDIVPWELGTSIIDNRRVAVYERKEMVQEILDSEISLDGSTPIHIKVIRDDCSEQSKVPKVRKRRRVKGLISQGAVQVRVP